MKVRQEIKAEAGRIVQRVKALASKPPRKHVCINNGSITNRLFLGFFFLKKTHIPKTTFQLLKTEQIGWI